MSKRANGEGTVFQRKDGRWQAQKSLAGDGLTPPRRVTVYGRTQREALDKLRTADRQTTAGVIPGRAPTVAKYGETWLGETKRIAVELGHLQATTVRNYRDIWTRHIAPDLGHLRLDQLTPPLLRQWQAAKAQQPSARGGSLSARSQTLIYAVLRTALNDAVIDGLLASNPLLKVKPPRGRGRSVEPLSSAEVSALLTARPDTQIATLILLMLATGARPGEALAASWADLDLDPDLDGGTWRISRSLGRVAGNDGAGRSALQFKPTKTAGSTATVALPAIAVAGLADHRRRQAAARLAARAWVDPDLVFTTHLGTPLEPRNVLRDFKVLAAEAGVERSIRLHDLRHAAASGLLAEGVPITVTSKLLRHTRLATTSDLYSHLTAEVRCEAAGAMHDRLRRLRGTTSG